MIDFEGVAASVVEGPANERDIWREVAGVTDPSEAWQRLARRSRIPAVWVADPSRIFFEWCAGCRHRAEPAASCAVCGGRTWLDHEAPSTVAACVAFASHAAAMSAAEAILRAHRPHVSKGQWDGRQVRWEVWSRADVAGLVGDLSRVAMSSPQQPPHVEVSMALLATGCVLGQRLWSPPILVVPAAGLPTD